MSARTYNLLSLAWLISAFVEIFYGAHEVVVIGSGILSMMCCATSDILKALPKPPVSAS